MPRLTNAQNQENYRKRKKEAEEGGFTEAENRQHSTCQRDVLRTICGSFVAWNTEDFFEDFTVSDIL
jgi:hypothetical protein